MIETIVEHFYGDRSHHENTQARGRHSISTCSSTCSAVRQLADVSHIIHTSCRCQLHCGFRAEAISSVRTTRNFVCFAKKSVNAKPFSVRTIFFVHENFVKRHQTSKRPSSSFGGLQFFVKRENLLFRDSYPSTGHHIS